MECFKCGANVPDESVYCYRCGQRLDGKVICPNCNKENANTPFCAYCGNQLQKENNENSPVNNKNGLAVASKILGFVGGGALMLGVLFSLIFVFLIGVNVGGLVSTMSANRNIYYYFSEYYKQLANASFYGLNSVNFYVYGVISTLIGASAIVLVVVFSTLAIVRYTRNMLKRSNKTADNFGVLAIICYFISAVLFYSMNFSQTSTSSVGGISIAAGLNGASVGGIAVCAIALGIYGACKVTTHILNMPTIQKDSILNISGKIGSIILAIVLIALAQGCGFVLNSLEYGETFSQNGGFMAANNSYIQIFQASNVPILSQLLMALPNIFAQLSLFLVIIFAFVTIVRCFKTIGENQKLKLRYPIVCLTFAVAVMVLSVISWHGFTECMSIIADSAVNETNFALEICLIIFAVLLLALTIVFNCLKVNGSVAQDQNNQLNNSDSVTGDSLQDSDAVKGDTLQDSDAVKGDTLQDSDNTKAESVT